MFPAGNRGFPHLSFSSKPVPMKPFMCQSSRHKSDFKAHGHVPLHPYISDPPPLLFPVATPQMPLLLPRGMCNRGSGSERWQLLAGFKGRWVGTFALPSHRFTLILPHSFGGVAPAPPPLPSAADLQHTGKFLFVGASKALLCTREWSWSYRADFFLSPPTLSTRSLGQADPCAAGRLRNRRVGGPGQVPGQLPLTCLSTDRLGLREMREGKGRRRNWEERRVGLGWGGGGLGRAVGWEEAPGPLADVLCDTGRPHDVTSLGLSFP